MQVCKMLKRNSKDLCEKHESMDPSCIGLKVQAWGVGVMFVELLITGWSTNQLYTGKSWAYEIILNL